MTCFDVFNGDADGLCALQQLRLVEPRDAVLVTGAKRDIALLGRITPAAGDEVTVLDVSLAVNREALDRVLAAGARVRYFDHHFAGDVPAHPLLAVTIDTAPQVCTAMIVDRHLGHRHVAWAVAGAYGDNMTSSAEGLAGRFGIAPAARRRLRLLGECLNYNAYGDSEADLMVHPAELHRAMRGHADPLSFADASPMLERLDSRRREDLARARASVPRLATPSVEVHVLEDTAGSRRVRGPFGNELVQRDPARAYAVLTPNAAGGYTVSVRTPAGGADVFCREFDTGGGRARAAGVDHLPEAALDDFVLRFEERFGRAAAR